MPTTSYGYDLSIGDDAGLDIPVCCDDDMTGTPTSHLGRAYRCDSCGTVLTVSSNDLVCDITGPEY